MKEDPYCSVLETRRCKSSRYVFYELLVEDRRTGCPFVLTSPKDWEVRKRAAAETASLTEEV